MCTLGCRKVCSVHLRLLQRVHFPVFQVTRSGSWGSVHVSGEEPVEGLAEAGGEQLRLRRAPVFLGGAPEGSPYLPPPELYKSGEGRLTTGSVSPCDRFAFQVSGVVFWA